MFKMGKITHGQNWGVMRLLRNLWLVLCKRVITMVITQKRHGEIRLGSAGIFTRLTKLLPDVSNRSPLLLVREGVSLNEPRLSPDSGNTTTPKFPKGRALSAQRPGFIRSFETHHQLDGLQTAHSMWVCLKLGEM